MSSISRLVSIEVKTRAANSRTVLARRVLARFEKQETVRDIMAKYEKKQQRAETEREAYSTTSVSAKNSNLPKSTHTCCSKVGRGGLCGELVSVEHGTCDAILSGMPGSHAKFEQLTRLGVGS